MACVLQNNRICIGVIVIIFAVASTVLIVGGVSNNVSTVWLRFHPTYACVYHMNHERLQAFVQIAFHTRTLHVVSGHDAHQVLSWHELKVILDFGLVTAPLAHHMRLCKTVATGGSNLTRLPQWY